MSIVAEAHPCMHLSATERVMLGSFYTPARYVRLAGDWLAECGLDRGCVVVDPSCGYGAFFDLFSRFPGNRYVGNDIDGDAVDEVAARFPSVQVFRKNALSGVCRRMYDIGEKERLVVVGNPPYNDVTSQINGEVKKHSRVEMDADVRSRDLGLSSLLAYNKLRADYVAVLHPLSYLIKRANYKAALPFFSNYRLLRHVVFNSQEFAGTSKLAGFPVLVGFYARHPGGMTFEEIRGMRFRTVEGDEFSLDQFQYISEFVRKYPSRRRPASGVMFYTMRDINALRRSRTFLAEATANAVCVAPEALPFYCYVDCFKECLDAVPYYLGNFDIPVDAAGVERHREELLAVSRWRHPEVFGRHRRPGEQVFAAVDGLVRRTICGRPPAQREG